MIEPFLGLGNFVSGGDKTNIKNKTSINKSFESNQKINRSMAVEAITKLVNNIATDVMQKNSAAAASAASASNVIWLQNVNCDDVVLSGISQKSQVVSDVQVKIQQQNKSKIANEISNSIDKTIEKVGGTDLEALEAENTKAVEDFMKQMPGYEPGKAQEMASQCPKAKDSFISVGNTCDVSNEYELNASVRKALDLDESFKIKDEDNVSNDIKNKVEQANFASCEATAAASNAIILSDIQCGAMNAINKAKSKDKAEAEGTELSKSKRGRLEISDVEQEAIAKLYMTCVFDQKNVSEISNKIMNKISKKYSQVYDAVKEKAKKKGPEYEAGAFGFLDAWSAAGMEKIAAAAGMLPKAQPKPKEEKQVVQEKTPDSGTTKEKTVKETGDVKRTPGFSSELPGRRAEAKESDFDDKRMIERKAKLDAEKKIANEKALAERKEQLAQEAAAKKAAADKKASDKAASDKAASDKAASDKKASDAAKAKADDNMMTYLIIGGIALVVLIIIIVVATSGGDSSSKATVMRPQMMMPQMMQQMRR